ncbi:MAG TPA: hypothetical protein VMV72_10095 [Verrucomicrobiae bacterium]|nr:hypothetical protein [Verrucomicrobiae bacterium]
MAVSAAICYQASAQNVYTPPVGFITWNIQGTTGSPLNPATTYLGLGMTQLPIQAGIVASVTSNQVVDSSNTFTNNQFTVAGVGSPCEIEFLSPTGSPTNYAYAGLIDEVVSSPAGNSIYLASTAEAGLIGAGYRYQIRPSWTLNTLFGTNDSAGLQAGSGSGSADNINVWNPNTQLYTTYYYRTGSGWRSTASLTINTGTNALYLDQGIVLVRRGAASVANQVIGAVKYSDINVAQLGPTIIPVIGGTKLTVAGNVEASSITLAQSGLYTGSSSTGVQTGSGSGSADNINVWNPTTQLFATYYYRTGAGWRSTASLTIDASTNLIPLGGAVQILRRNANSFNWYLPQVY